MNEIQRMITALSAGEPLRHEDWLRLITDASEEDRRFSRDLACELTQERFGRRVFFRGIIEFTNYCKNDCYYCGIRRSNRCLSRYRLTEDEILSCCEEGYRLGYRTFVLQGGEDGWWTDKKSMLLSGASARSIPTAPSRSRSAKNRARRIRRFSMPARTGICCATRR